jgi:hypothetical protein
METLRDVLAAKAEAVIPGERYNDFRRECEHLEWRLELAQDAGWPILHFEDVLAVDEPRRSLVERIVPSLVRFLDRKRQDPEHPRNVVVALFLGAVCFILPAQAVLDLFCELESASQQAFHSRVQSWTTSQ